MKQINCQGSPFIGYTAPSIRAPLILLIFCLILLAACDVSPLSEPSEPDQASETDNAAVGPESTPEPEEEAGESSESDADQANTNSNDDDGEQSGNEMSEGAAGQLEPMARNGMYSSPPEISIDPAKFYFATIKTEKGDMRLQLFAERAPLTVNNFIFLAREGYYNNTVFHRVLEGFMAQAGDPTGTGSGGPGYEFEDEFYPGLAFDRAGLLAMANRGPRTNGSQFFITFGPTEWLNGNHTIFGEVVEGVDVLNQLTRRDPGTAPDFAGDEILTILIEEADESTLPTPTPAPPTPTPTNTPTPYAPTSMERLESDDRPLAIVDPVERVNLFNTPPEETIIDLEKQYTASILTSKGELTVELFVDEAPISVNNFVVLVELGYFDGLPIALVNPEIVLFGSPDVADPTQDVGYLFEAEKNLSRPLVIGSMAYIPHRDNPTLSSGSQILMALVPPPAGIQSQFSFFAEITEGADILTELTPEDTIESVTITSE